MMSVFKPKREREVFPGRKSVFTSKQAAEYLGFSEQTLANWRHQRRGPAYIVVGKKAIRYLLKDLESFIAEQRKIEPIG